MGFNSAFKGLIKSLTELCYDYILFIFKIIILILNNTKKIILNDDVCYCFFLLLQF